MDMLGRCGNVSAVDRARIVDALVDVKFRRRYSPFLLALIEANLFDALPVEEEGEEEQQEEQEEEQEMDVDYVKLVFRDAAFRCNIAMFL